MGRKKLLKNQDQKKADQPQIADEAANDVDEKDQEPKEVKSNRTKKIQKASKKAKQSKKVAQLSQSQSQNDDVLQKQQPKKLEQQSPQIVAQDQQGKKQSPKKRPAKKKANKSQQQAQKNDQLDFNIFSASFNHKIQDFKRFFNEYLSSKKVQDKSLSFKQASNQLKNKIQDACIETLRGDIHTAINWLQGQKDKLISQIEKIQEGATQSRSILQKLGVFSTVEIDNQLTAIQNKRKEIESTLQKFEDMKTRANKLLEWKD